MTIRRKDYIYSFFIPYIIVGITLFALILMYSKSDLHLLLNSYHTPFLDTFFTYCTEFGATIPIVVAVVYLFIRFGKSAYISIVLVSNLLLTNGLKLLFREPRPKLFFSENFPDVTLQFIHGMRIYTKNGFPSGHTSAVFALMTCIALISKNRTVSFVCILLAVLTGYSRIYLSQHFAEDVLFGSVVGISGALAFYPFYMKWLNRGWATGSLTDLMRKK